MAGENERPEFTADQLRSQERVNTWDLPGKGEPRYITYTQAMWDRDFAASNEPPPYQVGQKVWDGRPVNGVLTMPDGTRVDWNKYQTDIKNKGGLGPEGWFGLALAGLGAGAFGPVIAGGAAAEGAAGAGALAGPEGAAGALGDAAWGVNPGGALGSEAVGTGAFDVGGSAGVMPHGTGSFGVTGGYVPPATMGGSGSAIGRLLGLSPGQSDLLNVGGQVAGSLVDFAGSKAQGNAYGDVSQQYLALGAADRARLDASYKPGFNIWDQAGYGDLLKSVTDAQLNQLSTKGNPFGNPSGLQQMNKNIMSQVGVPALTQYRQQLLQGGGVGLNPAASASLQQAGTAGAGFDALGSGIASLTTPKNDWEEIIKRLQGNAKVDLGGGYTSYGK